MKIAVTGATGFIGSRFCERARARGHGVITLSRSRGDRIWDPMTAETLAILPREQTTIGAVAFSADGSRLATGSHANRVRIFNGVPPHESWP